MRNYRRLVAFVRPHIYTLGAAFVCMFFTSILSAAPITMIIPLVDRIMADKLIVVPDYAHIPVVVTDLVNRINTTPRLGILNALIAVALVLTTLRSLVEYGYTYLMSDVSYRVIRDLRSALYSKIIHLPLGFFSHARSGALVSRITYDTSVVRDSISEGMKDFLFQPFELLANIAVLLAIRWVFSIPWSFIFTIAFVLPLIVYPVIRLGKVLKKISRQGQEQMADIHGSLFESISGIRVVQGFGMEEYETKRFCRHNESFYRTMMRAIARLLLIHPITEIVMILCACVVIWIGAREVIHRGMSPGAFMAFLTALFSLFRPFKRLSRLHSITQTAMAAADRVYEILDAPDGLPEPENPVFVPRIRDAIEFRNVSFAYEAAKPVLRDVTLKVRVGDIIAIVGPSGAGKTTLLNLVARFYDPAGGEILIDGVPIRNASIKSLRNQIGIVTQETILFNDTVGANIAYGRSNIAQAAVEAAARAANAHAFIRRLPNGYQTVVGDRGFKLSGGERQRIAIARALFKDPPILILDEATSALDSESEELVQKAIQNLMSGRTVLLVAHRLSTIRNATRIVVLENGAIMEQGTHEDLLGRNGPYKKIYQMQFVS